MMYQETIPGSDAVDERRVLFYPCCGDDLEPPVHYFWDEIDEFWFVDKRIPRLQQSLAEEIGLEVNQRLRRAIRHILKPQTRVECYCAIDRDNSKRIYCISADAEEIFPKMNRIDVFFYRGDSQGEGGSNIYWLDKYIQEILRKMPPKGYIVTDGSNCKDKSLEPLRRFHRSKDVNIGSLKTFEAYGRRFQFVRRLDDRYGPTLVWEVSRCINC